MPVKLTKRSVDAAKRSSERQYIFDTDLAGFGLAIQPSGVKSFFFQYRVVGSARKRRLTIGKYGAVTVDRARKIAEDYSHAAKKGSDPAAAISDSKAAPTMRELGADYLEGVDARRKPTTAREYRRLWTTHVLPRIGAVPVRDVTVEHLTNIHRRMKKTPYDANRTLAMLGAFFTFAETHGARAKHTNPATDVERYAEHARERFLTGDEVQRLGDALDQAERVGLPPAPTIAKHRKRAKGKTAKHRPKSADTLKPANAYMVAAIRFLLLSGWREGEALSLKWSDIDTERRYATLSDTKTGRSIRPLGGPALALLEALPRVKGSPYVFPGRAKGQPLTDITTVWYAVRHAAALDDVRLHDLRHSFASVVASAGGSLLLIGKLLGHKVPATTARYAHLFADPVHAAADATSTQLSDWLTRKP